jgi:hypothetical protein
VSHSESPTVPREVQYNTLRTQSQPTVSSHRHSVSGPCDSSDQVPPSHTSSTNGYEFALRGLLALGGTNTGAKSVPTPDASEQEAISTFDFGNNENVDPALDDGSVQRSPDLNRNVTGHKSNSSITDIEQRDTPVTLTIPFSGITDVVPVTPIWQHAGRSVSADQRLELLRFYRYYIAPWVRRMSYRSQNMLTCYSWTYATLINILEWHC